MRATVTVPELIDHFGSEAIMSKAIGVSRHVIYNWIRRGGCSESGALKIEINTHGKYKAKNIARAVYGSSETKPEQSPSTPIPGYRAQALAHE